MTDSEPAVDDADVGPITFAELRRRKGPKPIRELPALMASAVRLVHRAAPREFRAVMISSVVGGLLTALQLLTVQRLLTEVVDVSDRSDIVDLLPWLMGFVVAFTAIGVLGVFQGERRRVLSELVASHSQSVVALAAADADLVDFDRPAFHNRLQRALANASSRPVSLTYALITVATSGLTVVGVMVGLLLIQPAMLLLVLVAVGPVWLGTKRMTRMGYLFDLEETEADRRRGYFLHLLTDKRAAKELRAYQLSGAFNEQHRVLWAGRIERVRDFSKRRIRIGLIARLANSMLLAIVLLLLVWLVADGHVSVSDAAVVAGAIVILGQRLSAVVSSIGELYESALFLRDVDSFLVDAAEQRAGRGTVQLEQPFDEVVVDDVTFAYPAGGSDALRGVSVRVRRGEVVALVGANGSGKTTLAKLIAQLYRPATGMVTWNGVFRTMKPSRRVTQLEWTGPDRRVTHKTTEDPRHTRVGRFLRRTSLDELPQLINVLRGEMSLVGPRPEISAVVDRYDLRSHPRHTVTPGMTGEWQISHRSTGAPLHQCFDADLPYLEAVSFTNDLRVLARTVGVLGSGS